MEKEKNRDTAVCISCVHSECKFHRNRKKPKVKSEFISVLEPEIKRRISGLVVDATPVEIEEVIVTNHGRIQNDSSDDSDSSSSEN
jgi:hypothetical protein